MCVYDLLKLNVSRNMRYDIVSTYDTLTFSFFINWLSHQHFCRPGLHDTSYDTSTMASLRYCLLSMHFFYFTFNVFEGWEEFPQILKNPQ
jgi:hypothetical protein